ncbi:MAG: D-alanyl-D-alanine carboxypeptidase/D-alanyl-D-alanine-endopeptidase [Mycobacteriales bacterium]
MGTARVRGLVGLLVAATLAVGASTAVSLRSSQEISVRPPAPTAPPVRGALLPEVPGAAPAPTAAGLQAAVATALADPALAGRLAVSVVDATTGRPLLERGADRPLLPASTAKIATAVAALTALPPGSRLSTRVVAGTAPDEVVLVGGGDPTLAGPKDRPGYPGAARLTDLAARVRATLGAATVTRILVDESLYSGPRLGPGWKDSYVTQGAVAPVGPLMVDHGRVRPDRIRRHPDPAVAAGRALGALLQPGAPVEVARGRAAAGAAELGEVSSPPVPQLVERMLARSDNDLAEALLRQVAIAQGQPASFAGAAAAVRDVLGPFLDEVGVGRESVALVDGSGLSRLDRIEPAALTRLLARVASDDGSSTAERLAPVLTGLPVAGFSGTLSDRYRAGGGLPAAGVVRAKTGTLNGVSALAGLVRTADGRLLAFDLTADGVPLGATRRAEEALDRLAAALAACGCR